MLNALQVLPEPVSNLVMCKEVLILQEKSRINNFWLTLLLFVKTWNSILKPLNCMKKLSPFKRLPLFTWILKCLSKLPHWWKKSSLLRFWLSTVGPKSLKMLSRKLNRLMKMPNHGRTLFVWIWTILIILKNQKISSETNVQLPNYAEKRGYWKEAVEFSILANKKE